jgi:hypothetical protein
MVTIFIHHCLALIRGTAVLSEEGVFLRGSELAQLTDGILASILLGASCASSSWKSGDACRIEPCTAWKGEHLNPGFAQFSPEHLGESVLRIHSRYLRRHKGKEAISSSNSGKVKVECFQQTDPHVINVINQSTVTH